MLNWNPSWGMQLMVLVYYHKSTPGIFEVCFYSCSPFFVSEDTLSQGILAVCITLIYYFGRKVMKLFLMRTLWISMCEDWYVCCELWHKLYDICPVKITTSLVVWFIWGGSRSGRRQTSFKQANNLNNW